MLTIASVLAPKTVKKKKNQCVLDVSVSLGYGNIFCLKCFSLSYLGSN
jgi:hypothetical protein